MKKNLVKGYFKKNLGDDLFLKILLERYPNEKFVIYSKSDYKNVYDSNNYKILNNNKNLLNILRVLINKLLKVLKINKTLLIEDMKKFDNIILIGGSIFMENEQINYQKYKQCLLNYKKNNYILGANFGPYTTNKFIELHKYEIFPEIKDVCFRDKYSYDLFKDLENVRYASDIVFNLDISKYEKCEKDIAIISVIDVTKDNMNCSQKTYNNKIMELIEFLRNRKLNIILMSFSKEQGDEEIIDNIIKSLDNSNNVEKYFYRGNIDEALSIIASSKIIFGTRFHANILGLLFNKVVFPIAYSDKTINVLKDMNFKGKMFDIRDMDSLDFSSLKDEDLNYKHDISFQIKDSNRQFEALDRVFSKEEK